MKATGETSPLVDNDGDDTASTTTYRQRAMKRWVELFNILFIAYCILLFGPAWLMTKGSATSASVSSFTTVPTFFIRAWLYIGTWTIMHVFINGTMAYKYPTIYLMRSDPAFTKDGPRFGNFATFLIIISLLLTFVGASITYGVRYRHAEKEHMSSSSLASSTDSLEVLWTSIFGLILHCLGYVIFHVVPIQNKYAQKNLARQQSTEQQIVSTGLYAYVRHPMYLGSMMYQIGFAVFFQSWIALSMGIVLLSGLAIRIHLEEKQLQESLPQQYTPYMHQVPYRLIPRVF